jgi:hypothetical protein
MQSQRHWNPLQKKIMEEYQKDTSFEIKQMKCSSSNLFIYFQEFIYLLK